MENRPKRQKKSVPTPDGVDQVVEGQIMMRQYLPVPGDPYYGCFYEVIINKVYKNGYKTLVDIEWEDKSRFHTEKVDVNKVRPLWSNDMEPKVFEGNFDEKTRKWMGQKDENGAWKRQKKSAPIEPAAVSSAAARGAD